MDKFDIPGSTAATARLGSDFNFGPRGLQHRGNIRL
jgi:hypothetical protein